MGIIDPVTYMEIAKRLNAADCVNPLPARGSNPLSISFMGRQAVRQGT